MRTPNQNALRILILLALILLALLVLIGPAIAQQSYWYASYWNNTELSGAPAYQQIENKAPDVGWGEGAPAPGIQADYFSARWTADQYFEPGRYRFSLRTDDGARLWVNNQKVLDINATGQVFTADMDFKTAGPVPMMLEFYENKGNAGVHLTWERIGSVGSTGPIRAEYFNNASLAGTPALIRNEGPGLYHDWGNGSPDPSIYVDQFSARYTQAMNLVPGLYRFTAVSDDGIRFWINNQLVIDKWHDSSRAPVTKEVYLPGGIVNLMVHYYENVGGAIVSLTMTRVDGGGGSGSGSYPGPGGGGGYPGPGGGGGYPGPGGGGGTGTTPPPQSTYGTVNTTAVYLRSGPGTEFEPIDSLLYGERVMLTGQYDGYWVHVLTENKLAGWVMARYLDYNMPVGEAPVG